MFTYAELRRLREKNSRLQEARNDCNTIYSFLKTSQRKVSVSLVVTAKPRGVSVRKQIKASISL